MGRPYVHLKKLGVMLLEDDTHSRREVNRKVVYRSVGTTVILPPPFQNCSLVFETSILKVSYSTHFHSLIFCPMRPCH